MQLIQVHALKRYSLLHVVYVCACIIVMLVLQWLLRNTVTSVCVAISLCVVNFTVEMWSVNAVASAMTCRLVLFGLTRGACAVRTR